MRISLVRQRLADAVADVSVTLPEGGTQKLATYGYVPDAITAPCFYPAEVTLDPLVTFSTTDNVDITCRVLVSRGDDKEGQYLLDELLRRSGASSIRAALDAARGAPGAYALSGACDDLVVRSIEGYRLYRVGEIAYYGAEIIVRAVGNGDQD